MTMSTPEQHQPSQPDETSASSSDETASHNNCSSSRNSSSTNTNNNTQHSAASESSSLTHPRSSPFSPGRHETKQYKNEMDDIEAQHETYKDNKDDNKKKTTANTTDNNSKVPPQRTVANTTNKPYTNPNKNTLHKKIVDCFYNSNNDVNGGSNNNNNQDDDKANTTTAVSATIPAVAQTVTTLKPLSSSSSLQGGVAVAASPTKFTPAAAGGGDDACSVGSRDSSSGSHNLRTIKTLRAAGFPIWVTVSLIIFLGAVTCGAFLAIGITAARQDQLDQFDRLAIDLVHQIQRAWEDYVTAASWIHGRCRGRTFSRSDFRQSYEYLVANGLDFQAMQFDPNITRDERAWAEEEARQFYAQHYPHIEYRGLVGFETANSTTLEPRSEQDFYFPIHYMEPIIGNERAIDLDYHASGSRKRTVLFCINEGKPALTDRLRLVQETTESAFGVVLMHPGFDLTDVTFELKAAEAAALENGGYDQFNVSDLDAESYRDPWPRDLASIVIRIPDLIRRAGKKRGEKSAVYLFDKSDSGGSPLFLGAASIVPNTTVAGRADLTFLPEKTLDELMAFVQDRRVLYHQETVEAANKEWIVTVHSLEGTYKANTIFVVLGGVIIFVASVALALWLYTNQKRIDAYNKERSEAESERAALILDNARQATKAERELNDFIAHEVRNPVAAAMSAVSFVKNAIEVDEPLKTEEQKAETRDDVNIIDNALRFVNDLLRNMLDMHRAANKQLKVNMTPTDLMHDVLESVQVMLPQRDARFSVEVDCPPGLVCMTDRLRLKQVCLNLARNSVKFIHEGFIRLRADVINNEVHLFVEDSGPGIPLEKRQMLFSKFQESLDSLSQGTGIGLFLCKNLVALMDGEIKLDEDYDSGVPGNPGTRFVVNLKQPPIDVTVLQDYHTHHTNHTSMGGTGETVPLSDDEESLPHELPESLSVLFVDDDPILRKLFSRTIRTVVPSWSIREAANGETALHLVETDHFDLIFMDMYMASVEKQLLGTEAVRELRKRGVDCRICGLSANDKEMEFLQAGADSFCFKPFPCEPVALTQELCRVLYADAANSQHS